MKQLLELSLALLFYVSSGLAQQSPSQADPQATRDTVSPELVTLTNTWTDAINAKDHAKIEELVAPEFALYRWNGEPMSQRPDWLDFLYHTEIKEYTVRNISARAYGDFGVVTPVCTWTGVHNGSPFDLHSVMVDT